MKEYKHAFRRWIQKMYIDSVRTMDYERGTRTKYELDCLAICKKLIDKPKITPKIKKLKLLKFQPSKSLAI